MDDRFYAKEYVCPICEHHYTALRPRQRACIPSGRESDFNVLYQDLSCLFYEVVVCPSCGYAATKNMADPSVAARKVYLANIAPRWQARDLNVVRNADEAVVCFKLALLCAQIRSDKASTLASLSLRLAWIYRGLGDREQEDRFLAMALSDYEAAYGREDLDEDGKEFTIAYLIGELHRRLGRPDQALRWFGIVINDPQAARKPQVIKMAREQWHLIREEKKAAQVQA